MDDFTTADLQRLRDLLELQLQRTDRGARARDILMLQRIKTEIERRYLVEARRPPVQRDPCPTCGKPVAKRGRRLGRTVRHLCQHRKDCEIIRVRGVHMPGCHECRTPEQRAAAQALVGRTS